MVRRFILGAALGLLAATAAVPAEAAEWCMNDPALVFTAPHHGHKLTVYATEGVQGTNHAGALLRAHVELKSKPGKQRGTIEVKVHGNIGGGDHDRYATVLVVSSQPYGQGTIYGFASGQNGHDIVVSFVLVYDGG